MECQQEIFTGAEMKYKITDIHKSDSWYYDKEWHIGKVLIDIYKEAMGDGWFFVRGKLEDPPDYRASHRVFHKVKLQELK